MNTDYLIDERGNVLIVIGDEVENMDARFFVGAINTSQELCSIDKTKPFSALGDSPLRNCIEQGNYSASAKTLRVIKAHAALTTPVVPDARAQEIQRLRDIIKTQRELNSAHVQANAIMAQGNQQMRAHIQEAADDSIKNSVAASKNGNQYDAVFFLKLRDWHLDALKEQKHVD